LTAIPQLDFLGNGTVLGSLEQPGDTDMFKFTTTDFEAIPLNTDDFVYADPPYDVEFTAYAQGGFSWNDQTRVAEYFARHRGPVVLVNQSTKRIEELYRSLGYAVDHLDAPRRISCTGDRRPAREVVAVRNLN
jgi:DNA adenine methylase